MSPVVLGLASVVAVSLISLLGLVTLSMSDVRVRRLATFFVSFAVGALLDDAFIHLIPETFAKDPARGTPLARSLHSFRALAAQSILISFGIAVMGLLTLLG